MLNDRELSSAIGSTAYDPDGDKIGTVEHFFVDDRTGAATWVAVTTGLFGTRHSVVPVGEAVVDEGALRLPFSREAVRSAPHVPDPSRLDAGTEAELRRHYGLPAPEAAPGASPGDAGLAGATSRTDHAGEERPSGRHAAEEDDRPAGWSPTDTGVVPVGAVGRRTDEPPGPVAVSDEEVAAARGEDPAPAASVTRHEEQVQVTRERVPVRRVRLVKYVVTEEVQITVPVRREEVRLEELPLDADPGAGGPAGESLLPPRPDRDAGLPHEVVLHAERPVVSVEVVPLERVRLRVEEVAGEAVVEERLDRERVILDED